MITIEVMTPGGYGRWRMVMKASVSEPERATALLADALARADVEQTPRLRVRVTGGPTAASCRHHPLAPGTIGDPRR